MNTVCKVPDLCWSPRPAAAAVFVDAVNGLQTFFFKPRNLSPEVEKGGLETLSDSFTRVYRLVWEFADV